MATRPVILVTGSAGKVGRAVVLELLARGHAVRGLDRVPTPDLHDHHVGDICSPAACKKAMVCVSTLIHLAATPDDVPDPVKDLFRPNIEGVYHVFEAAREAGVKRLIVASSGQVVWGQRLTGPYPITTEVPPTPKSWYAATKMFLEAAARSYADSVRAQVLVARLGWCPRPGQEKEIAAEEWAQDVYLSPGDAGRFFADAVETPVKFHFEIVYATSRSIREPIVDLAPAKLFLGFEPQDQWPDGVD